MSTGNKTDIVTGVFNGIGFAMAGDISKPATVRELFDGVSVV
jgi:hypothetical protein